ncbi:LLM class flavin-dependent oxidoreductase [Ktedonobacter sp. SOSP1-52]|uniref:LLM class flavin-dependent oxidoreductase n=1 Tax=Ktedonobacter sp. SOSP1-52 TaxID=2778366 RepID=UPI0035B20CE5
MTSYVRQRSGHDYQEHCQVGASHAEFVTDEVVDRFCVIGTMAQCRQRIRELAAIGVNEFNLYLMAKEQEHLLEIYGREIIPAFIDTPLDKSWGFFLHPGNVLTPIAESA